MVTNAALIVRPNMDSPENGGAAGPYSYGEVWMQSVLNSLAFRGVRKQLYGDDAVASKFISAIESLNPSLVVGMGHGNAEAYAGQYTEGGYSILLTTANADLMAGRVVYLLSCLTAQELGPMMEARGATAYAGYNQEFVWTVSTPESPATDPLAAPFARASTMYPKVLIAGKTVEEAREEAIKTFNQEIEAWEQSTDTYAREVVKWLLWDRDAFTVLGDEAAVGFIPSTRTVLIAAGVIGVAAIGYWIYKRRKRG
jgi:hypothetical protein